MKKGDLITGKDRSYTRSIYQIASLKPLLLKIVSYDGYVFKNSKELEHGVHDAYKCTHLSDNTFVITPTNFVKSKLEDFRLATEEEILSSRLKKNKN